MPEALLNADRSGLLRTPLHGDWTVEALDGPTPVDFPSTPIAAVVPGTVHTDLLRAGLIADPFDGDNEAAQQWIADVAWRYRTTFTWEPAPDAVRHDLVADGLDTLAVLRVNGTEIGRTENQHRSYRFDVRQVLVTGVNTLEIDFAAPVPEAEARAARYGALPRVNHHDYNQLRKTASSFGWDWGIDAATSGVWRPIAIESWSGVRIAGVRPLVDINGDTGVLRAIVDLEHADRERADTTVDEGDETLSVRIADQEVSLPIASDATEVTAEVRIPAVRRWWPIGHGDQPLYALEIRTPDDVWSREIGFRTVRVDVEPDAAGRPFQVIVNDRPVIVRGVNWIPDHAFQTEITADRIRRRFDDMVEGNVNLVRVWGGGIYESDTFYDEADRRGVLVWQDFLFACAAYSEDEHLAVEVEAEAREQIVRLSSHPSLVIWNGNNENIWAYADWGWPNQLGDRSWGDGYYRTLLPNLVAELDPTRFYSPGSPFSFGEYLHPNDQRNGTMHIWDVWNQRDYGAYREYLPRFVSEFGFQGPPAWSTLTRVVHDEPLDPFGHEMLVHQKANLGNDKLARGMRGRLPEPVTIEDWHWATQLNQANAIRFGVEHFRSLAPHTSGTILWQLNDNWPVVSWAAVDFDGHRKPLWFAMRDAYAPRLATIQPRPSDAAWQQSFEGSRPVSDALALVVLNDTDDAVDGSFTIRRERFDGTVVRSDVLTVEVGPRSQVTQLLSEALTADLDGTTEVLVAVPGTDLLGYRQAVWNTAEVVEQHLDPAPVDVHAERTVAGVQVVVEARSYARDITLLVDRVDPDATVDDGMVTLAAGDRATFTIRTAVDVDPERFLDPLVLRTANGLRR